MMREDAAARYGYLFSQATTEILSQAEAEIRNQGVSADRDPAGIDSAGGVSAGSDPAGGNPAVPSDVCKDKLSSGIFTSSSYDDDFSATLTNLAPAVEVNPVSYKIRVNHNVPQSQISWARIEAIQTVLALLLRWAFGLHQAPRAGMKIVCFSVTTQLLKKKVYFVAAASCCAQNPGLSSEGLRLIEIRHNFNRAKAFDGPRFEYLVVRLVGESIFRELRGRLVSADSTMILLVAILPAGCFVSAGSYGLCCWFRVHAGGHISAGGFISADRVCDIVVGWSIPLVTLVSAGSTPHLAGCNNVSASDICCACFT
ncbi:hypothetical protein Tco_0941245 [Tanacetum coccineum]|uniref:Uncharacterized protein n=1 Tax=Tanacetum coccineum TaxID=301880 RepID=A0ABQ5DQV0_9ASTR